MANHQILCNTHQQHYQAQASKFKSLSMDPTIWLSSGLLLKTLVQVIAQHCQF